MENSDLKIHRSIRKNTMSKGCSIDKEEFICLEVEVSTESDWYKNVYEIAKEIEKN